MPSNLCNRLIIGVIRDFWIFSEISNFLCPSPVFSLIGKFQKVIDTEGWVSKPLEGGHSGGYGKSSSVSSISFGLGLRLLAETDLRWPV
jgi:hypothetical protein